MEKSFNSSITKFQLHIYNAEPRGTATRDKYFIQNTGVCFKLYILISFNRHFEQNRILLPGRDLKDGNRVLNHGAPLQYRRVLCFILKVIYCWQSFHKDKFIKLFLFTKYIIMHIKKNSIVFTFLLPKVKETLKSDPFLTKLKNGVDIFKHIRRQALYLV